MPCPVAPLVLMPITLPLPIHPSVVPVRLCRVPVAITLQTPEIAMTAMSARMILS